MKLSTSTLRIGLLLIVLTLLPAAGAQAEAGARLRAVANAYSDVFEHYPEFYTCELRSPELVASLDARGREAWGKGHIRITQSSEGLRLSAESLAKPQAKPWFNLALGLWQLKLGTELKILQSRLPEFFVATALGALLRYRSFEAQEDHLVRVGLEARRQDEPIREASFLIAEDNALREIRIRNRDGSSVVVEIENIPALGIEDRWLVSRLEATVTQASGATEVLTASLGYVMVDNQLLFEHIVLRLTDADGQLLRKKPKDINPISYYFSNCRLLDGA